MDEQLQGDQLLNCRNYIGKLIREAQVDMEVDATLQNACAIDIKVRYSPVQLSRHMKTL